MLNKIKKYFLKKEKLIQQEISHSPLLIYWGPDSVEKKKKMLVLSHQSKKWAKRFLVLALFSTLVFTVIRIYNTGLKPARAAWYDDAYAYRQLFTFTHDADISSDRAVTFSLDTAELIAAGVMQSDCDDTRFTNINGMLLRYQLTGTCNNAATTYEVVFPSIVNGTNSAYVYYGNPAAASKSEDVSGFTALTPSGGDPSITDRTGEAKGISPQVYLKFDEGYGTSTNDSSPNNNDGSISGATWRTSADCLSENCFYFDGSNDLITVTNADSIDLDRHLAGGFTISTWIRPNGAGEGTGGQIFYKGTNTWLRVDTLSSGKLDIQASLNLSTPATLNVSAVIDNNKWNHVALSYTDDGDDEITIWVNGRSVGTSSDGVGAPAADSNDILIGGTTTNNFQGFIDEFKIYKQEKTAAEIKTIAQKVPLSHGVAAIFSPDTSFISQGLISWWKMDESAADSCTGASNDSCDSSGNNNDAAWNAQVTPAAGKFGNGTTFDGTGDYIDAGDIGL